MRVAIVYCPEKNGYVYFGKWGSTQFTPNKKEAYVFSPAYTAEHFVLNYEGAKQREFRIEKYSLTRVNNGEKMYTKEQARADYHRN